MTLTPRKLLAAAAVTAALGACSTAGRAPAARTAAPAPVENAAPAPRAEVVPAPVTAASVAEPITAPAPAAQPMTDEDGRPLCGNVRSKKPTSDCK